MKRCLVVVWVLGRLGGAALGFAQTSLLPDQAPVSASAYGVTKSVVPVQGAGFSQAVRLRTANQPRNPWDAGLTVPTTAALAVGDVVAGECWVRRLAPADGDAFVVLNVEKAGPDYDKSLSVTWVSGSTNWARFRFAFKSVGNYGAGQAHVAFHLGFPPQTLELGGLRMTNWAKARTLTEFPNDLTYSGREADAPWRAAAAERIRQLRQADMEVEVKDSTGAPVSGAEVRVRMKRHAFGFGSAVDGARLLGRVGNVADRDRYRGVITNWFNKVVLENDLKWPVWERVTSLPGQPFGSNTATNALKWLVERGIFVRGHNLIWPGTAQSYFLPADVPGLFGDPPALRRRVNEHFTNILTRTAGLCSEWDVVNEPYVNHAVMDVLGRGEMLEWFKLAQALAPEAVLYLNEYGNLESAGLDSAQTEDFFQQLRFLQEGGAPLGGVGMQSHFGSFLPGPQRLQAMLDRFAVFGLPIQATEFDVDVKDPAVQADYLRDFLTTLFAHPAVNGVMMWGFWEGQHWLPDAALIRRDWSLKPNGVAWTNLVLGTWWTSTNVVTGTNGVARVRGFKGDYELEVMTPATTNRHSIQLLKDLHVDSVTSPARGPRLQVALTQGRLEVSWPDADAPAGSVVELEQTAAFGPAQWSRVPIDATRSAEGWRMTVSIEPAAPRFFRLVKRAF